MMPAVSDLIWLNGSLVPEHEAVVSPLDHGVTVGDGVFETMQIIEGRAFAITRHLRRLRRSLDGLRSSAQVDDDELARAVAATIEANGLRAGRVRLTVTTGTGPLGSDRGGGASTVMVVATEQPPWPSATPVVTVPWRRNEHGATAGLKTTSYAENVIALDHAHDLGASEAIFANTAGALCEGTGTNIFIRRGDGFVTPPLTSGCLAGITRELVLELDGTVADVPLREADISFDELSTTGEAFLTSSTRDVQAISRIDDRELADAPGDATGAVAAAFAALLARDLDP